MAEQHPHPDTDSSREAVQYLDYSNKTTGLIRNPELHHALVRFVFLLFGLIFFGIGVYYNYYPITLQGYITYAICYALVLVITALSIIQWPDVPWRHYVVVLTDVVAITFGILATGESNSPLFILYIWVLVGQALRFGRKLLYAAQAFCIAAYFFVLFYYADYHQHLLETAFLILTLLLLPFYLDAVLALVHAARQEADQANKSKSIFLANMSHELRTPLNAIIGYTEILREDAEDNNHYQYINDLNRIYSAGNHLLSLINDVLDLSKIEAGKVELEYTNFDIRSLIQDVVTTCTPLIQKNNNHLKLNIQPEIGRMHADATKVRQTLFNLLSNASKFTENGEISISASRQNINNRPVIMFKVKDNGIGISSEQQQRLFKPFSQADVSTSRKFGGTGLGLTICQRYCQLMGGLITFESAIDKGSTFTITLPA